MKSGFVAAQIIACDWLNSFHFAIQGKTVGKNFINLFYYFNFIKLNPFHLKSGFEDAELCFLFKLRHLFRTVVDFVYKWARQFFSVDHKIISDWSIFFENIIHISGLFHVALPFFKVGSICKGKKRRQSVQFLK